LAGVLPQTPVYSWISGCLLLREGEKRGKGMGGRGGEGWKGNEI